MISTSLLISFYILLDANVFDSILAFFKEFGWQAGFGSMLLYNIYLTIAWIRREKHIQLVEIAFENLMPKIKFELNKDEKLKSVVEENIKLKAENALLREKNDSLPFIVIGILFIAMLVAFLIRRKTDKPLDDDSNIDKLTEPEKEKLLSNDKDPFSLKDFNEKFKNMKFNFSKIEKK